MLQRFEAALGAQYAPTQVADRQALDNGDRGGYQRERPRKR